METDNTPKPSCFENYNRVNSQTLCLDQNQDRAQVLKFIPAEDRNSVFSRLGEVIKVQSFVPSRMKHISTLDVMIDGSLKVKRCTLVITNYEASSNSKEKIKWDGQASFHPVTV